MAKTGCVWPIIRNLFATLLQHWYVILFEPKRWQQPLIIQYQKLKRQFLFDFILCFGFLIFLIWLPTFFYFTHNFIVETAVQSDWKIFSSVNCLGWSVKISDTKSIKILRIERQDLSCYVFFVVKIFVTTIWRHNFTFILCFDFMIFIIWFPAVHILHNFLQ